MSFASLVSRLFASSARSYKELFHSLWFLLYGFILYGFLEGLRDQLIISWSHFKAMLSVLTHLDSPFKHLGLLLPPILVVKRTIINILSINEHPIPIPVIRLN